MVKKILIAASDDEVRKFLLKGLAPQFGERNVEICNTSKDLNFSCKYSKDVAVIFDKYFLGYVISFELLRLKIINKQLLVYFAEIGNISETYAIRACQYQVDGYISSIEDSVHLREEILNIKDGKRLIPTDVSKALKGLNLNLNERHVTELSEREMQVAMLLGEGYSQKEISGIMHISPGTVSQHVTRLNRKIGYTGPKDYYLLNESYWKEIGGVRSAG